MRPLRSQLPQIYGAITDGIWAERSMWTMALPVPTFLYSFWRYGGLPVHAVTVNKDMAGPLKAAWQNVADRGCASMISSFDGCFAIRQSRTDARPSVHSWALAIDICASENKLGTPGAMDPRLVACFTDAGFIWGGAWTTVKDPMHLQYVTED
jgi:hypothetical protein